MTVSRWRCLPVGFALFCLALGAMMAWARNPWHEQRLALQPRANAPSARLVEGTTISQTFRSPAANLVGIELLAVLPQPLSGDSPVHATLTLERLDDPSRPPLTVMRPLADVRHNDPLRFDLPPLPDAQGALYRLTLAAEGAPSLAVWASAEESYAEGTYWLGGAPQAGDLHLTLYARYTLRQAVTDALRLFGRGAMPLAALALFLWLPGLALTLWLLPLRTLDPFALAALALALGLAIWPLLMLWLTVLGAALSAGEIWAVLALSAAALVGRAVQLRRRGLPICRPWPGLGPSVTLMAVLSLGAALRLVQSRELLVPNWVDGYHHTVLAQIMAETGRLPVDGAPYVQMSLFHYHFGFHATAAALARWSGLSTPQAVLWLGYLLNALAALTTYALATHLARRPWAGVAGATVTACIAYMPSYYVSWGRYTQLMGLVMLAPLWILTEWALCVGRERLSEDRRSGGVGRDTAPLCSCRTRAMHNKDAEALGARHVVPLRAELTQITSQMLSQRRVSKASWLTLAPCGGIAAALGLLAGGLALTHYRVLAFYVVYVILRLATLGLEAAWAWRHSTSRPSLHALVPLLGGALMALLWVAPWATRFVAVARQVVPDVYGGWEMPSVVQDPIPMALLRYGWTPLLLLVAALGALWAAARRQRDLLLLTVWCGALLLWANPQVLGATKVWFINNGPVIISFWMPSAALAGWLVADVAGLIGDWAARWRVGSAARGWTSALLAVSLLSLAGWGAWRLVDVVNPTTVLVKPEDIQAMDWVREHTPSDARFLINTRPWMNEVRRGADGGWWLPILAERSASLPCILYTQGPPDYRQEVQGLAAAVEASPALDDAALLERLRAAGITHIYLGALPGPMTARVLDAHPLLETLYVQGPVRVYAFR